MLTLSGEADSQQALEQIIEDLVKVGGYLLDFVGYMMELIFVRHFGQNWADFETEELEVSTTSSLNNFKIPFFIESGIEGNT